HSVAMAPADSLPSTQNLRALPMPGALWRRSVALALLARAREGGGALPPRFDYEPEGWPGVARFTSDNGAGDVFFVAFAPGGVLLKGFDHESPMSPYRLSPDGTKVWPGMYAAVPPALAALAREPAAAGARPTDVTFCLSYAYERPGWACGVERFDRRGDGSAIWLRFLTMSADEYRDWADDYYESALPPELVEALFEHRPFGAIDAGPAVDGDALARLAAAWGYGGPGPVPPADAAPPGVRRVRHAKFGDGQLIREAEGKVEVAFAAGVRVLDRRFVTFLDEGPGRALPSV
ncbi:MAG TPA: hypothetical protein VFS00_32135, partial [Polyangiaceae bacterium]|nr:hypothetical protein [Polyangiaceae bacterium]